ncbi:MAG: hypothetical protein DME26_21585 [Verrucomicrobia bacterium]|nr:MAG: hypothetical protein DME26_21585 [Verrucomicrobiota bacterium]
MRRSRAPERGIQSLCEKYQNAPFSSFSSFVLESPCKIEDEDENDDEDEPVRRISLALGVGGTLKRAEAHAPERGIHAASMFNRQ